MTEILPAAPLVNASRFRAAHEGDWDRLERIITRMEKRSVGALDDEDILALPLLYRTTLSSLSVVRETSLDRALATYLERLCTRAYFQLYGVQTSPWRQLGAFFATGWPRAARSLWRETVFCIALMVAGTLAGYFLVHSDPAWFYALIPEDLAGGRTPTASAESLRNTLYDTGGEGALAAFATALYTHNSQVAIFAFALGFAFAVPTLLLVIYNGLSLGAMIAVFADKGLGVNFAGWLTIHGTTELLAVALAAAAGTRIGSAVAFPGREARSEAAVTAGREAATVMAGAVCMLLVAGILEGIGRQTVVSDALRFGIGGAALAGWLAYLYLPRRTGAA
ncbi:stage II sporulation protein M [Sphingomonas floccifaciens]|uniref:Stage II sporulation protein M n=1 Tax=Sphingomonas floccifaciens TaxID=1844115 RepID=A0ABW4N9N0_9SPHN